MSNPTSDKASLQLLLFVDRRPGTREQVRQIRVLLQDLQQSKTFDLKVIDVIEHPYLAERFRIIATPSLVKISPEPKQTLAGLNLASQLQLWWPRWESSTGYLPPSDLFSQADQSDDSIGPDVGEGFLDNVRLDDVGDLAQHAELIKRSDEVFQLRQERDDLASQLRFRDQIIAMLAHDIRNPLTAASIAVETLEIANRPSTDESNRYVTPAMRTKLLHQARTQLRIMNMMITDILEATRGHHAGIEIKPIALDLASVCGEVIQALDSKMAEKNQHLTTDIPSDLPPVYGDPDRIKQVISNLLDNAIKYSPSSGTIDLSILHRTAQKIQISISDNGLGIPDVSRNHIFEEHYRLKRDESQQGYGIGLSVCQQIVRAHYGQIWVDSAPDQGSRFHFTLPVYRS
ncbi:MAG: histidine kinase [Alkalinema sp. CAN_BIN05]|nr:histidine kinase [Alkalinema sp. CAN_BIN05]